MIYIHFKDFVARRILFIYQLLIKFKLIS